MAQGEERNWHLFVPILTCIALVSAACAAPQASTAAHRTETERPLLRGCSVESRTSSAQDTTVHPMRDLSRIEVDDVPIWIDVGRERAVYEDFRGIAYGGNRDDDDLATCADPAADEDCEAGRTLVYPGSAWDPVCGERHRCMPLARARIITSDHTGVLVRDEFADPLPIGCSVDETPFVTIDPGVMGTLAVTTRRGSAAQFELIALDYGAAYTIHVSEYRVMRITQEPMRRFAVADHAAR